MKQLKQRPLGAWDSRAPARRRKHGLSPDELDFLLRQQGGVCAICGGSDPGPAGWATDHSHALALLHGHPVNVGCRYCVRGLIHDRENVGLGCFKDDPALLRRAADYLERHQ